MGLWKLLISLSLVLASSLGLLVLSGSARNLAAPSLEARLVVQEYPIPEGFGVDPNMVASFMAERLTQRLDDDIALRLTLKPDARKSVKEIVIPRLMNVVVVEAMMKEIPELSAMLELGAIRRTVTGQVSSSTAVKDVALTVPGALFAEVDGEKLKLLVHDESGKWEKPDNILNNWRVTKTTMRLGSKIVGKCMMGSTSNAIEKGGGNFKKLYYASDVTQRNRNGQTSSGLYSLFIPMEWNYEGFIDAYGVPVFDKPKDAVRDPHGDLITTGVIEHWENEVDGLKNDQDGLNEYYRQFPRTEKHAFRDEAKLSLFNLTRIYEQIDYNEDMRNKALVTQGNFQWARGVKDTTVNFIPENNGRFLVSWIPPARLQNRVIIKNGVKHPGNEHVGAFGCDSYDISGTVDNKGSKGSLHGLTKFSMEEAPFNMFFLEYISRPPTAEIFFEDVLMALHFYGMPILAENNKPRLLYYLKRRGYRNFSINRPDKTFNKLSVAEREIGGIPNSSEDIKQAHAAAIESYIEDHVGLKETEYGQMYFQRTLEDWAKFNINNRTKFDATISSGLAIMACNKNKYSPVAEIKKQPVNINFKKYDNTGSTSKIIK